MGSPTVNAPALRATWRALKRGPLLLSGTAAAVLVGATTAALDDGYAVQVLRGAAILLAGGLAVALDDPAADLLAASPTTLARRWAARLGLAIGVTAGCWGLLLAWVGVVVHGVPWLALSVEAAALGGLALAISAALRRWRDVREPGALAAPVLFGAVLAANLLPQRWALFAGDPAGAGWTAAHGRWTAVMVTAVAVVAVAGRDPARRRRCGG